jgi:putative glutamine amidotransferase
MKSRSLASRADRPLIGVTTSEVRRAESINPTPRGEPPRLEMALGLSYLRALEAAGALPLVIPPLALEAIEPLLDRLDGICLSGGPDLDPEAYGARPHPELGPVEKDLDRFELAIARRADSRLMPILAICRGMQALNVVRGGTLNQHIPDLPGVIPHRQHEPGDVPTHGVTVCADTRLQRALGVGELDVNSFHHQAIERLGESLEEVATAPDGTIEGIEDRTRPFVLGVQWHAEAMSGRETEARLFESFVEACRSEGEEARAAAEKRSVA